FDIGRILEFYDPSLSISGPMIVSQAMIDAGTGGNMILSASAMPGAGGADPLAFGWTNQTLDEVRDLAGVDIRAIFAPYAQIPSAIVRPASLANGGFANISLQAPGRMQLEGANLAASRSVAIDGPLINGNGGSSTIRAPYISLIGGLARSQFSTGALTFS